MADDNGVGKGLILGFFTGAVVGSIVSLLYAPKSGKELRSDIKDKSDDFFKETEEYLEQAKDKADKLINDGKKKSEKMIGEAKEKVNALLEEAEAILDNAKKKTGDYVDKGKSKIENKGDKLKSAIKAGLDTYNKEKDEEA